MHFLSVVPSPELSPQVHTQFERVIATHNTVRSEQHAFDPFDQLPRTGR
jgi:hypothetical protein